MHTIPAIYIDTSLELFHLTYRNTQKMQKLLRDEQNEACDYLSSVKEGDYLRDLEHTKFFSLGKFHPLYYSFEPYGEDQVALHYKLIRPLMLLDGRKYKKSDISGFLNQLDNDERLRGELDGWLIKDDHLDNYHEICLFSSIGKIDPNCEEIVYDIDTRDQFNKLVDQTNAYPYGKQELQSIAKATINQGEIRINEQVEITWDD